jgi:hypothetical protein
MLKPVDMKLLRAAVESNGGGANADMFSDASCTRLMKADLIRLKPNNRTMVSLLIATPKGRDELKRREVNVNQSSGGESADA